MLVTLAYFLLKYNCWGVWVAQSVKCPTSAQVTISQSVSSSPASGSVLTAWSLEPASDSVSSSLSDPPPVRALSLSVSKINKRLKKNLKKKIFVFVFGFQQIGRAHV